MKEQIIDSLYKIMCSATSTVGDVRVQNNDYFKRRVLGFRAEIEFENLINERKEIKFFEGGQFINKTIDGTKNDKNSFIYTTLSFDNQDEYINIYKTISRWNEVSELIYIKILDNAWTTEEFETKENKDSDRIKNEIMKPNFVFYIFNKKSNSFIQQESTDFTYILKHFPNSGRKASIFPLRKREQFNYFSEYDLKILKKIYANRYFLDVIMRQAQGRQIIDLDGFIEHNNSLILVEIKEKSPINDKPKQEDWRYGWDSRRILWYLYLLKNIQIPILYNIRQINNRNERLFVQWDSIFIDDFLKGTSWSTSRSGGGGEDTLLAPYSFFSDLDEILRCRF